MHGHLVNVTPKIESKGLQRASSQMLVDLWADSLVRGIPQRISVDDGLMINRIAGAFYESHASGREVTLPSSGS